MSRGSLSVDVWTGVSIDVGWTMSVMEDECLRSTVVSEYQSTGIVHGSTAVERNRAMNRCCCRSMRSVLLCGSNAPNLQDLVQVLLSIDEERASLRVERSKLAGSVSIDDPIGILIDSPFAPSIDYAIMISIDALLDKLYAQVEW
ncbi:hypothetical protein F2Q68_00017260 [Brassica cretica]|uniref:Uncharacterized protein n=1 Tax=Brassica cretica TaxID=69181 RepID=A0A8S9HA38_BRACR|nr:hypothetical protein F2Q68_00017260 [Brassica cretica]